jgi:hypothetical protein
MFQSYFQGGVACEIFSSQGAASNLSWRLNTSLIKKSYEKDLKG